MIWRIVCLGTEVNIVRGVISPAYFSAVSISKFFCGVVWCGVRAKTKGLWHDCGSREALLTMGYLTDG